ncbi:MAG: signal peptidase I, partial [Acidimicrobiales bacterium]
AAPGGAGRAPGSSPPTTAPGATGATPPPASEVTTPARRRTRWIVEWVIVLVVALLVALGVRAFVVQTFFIPSASMEPTLMIGDRILVDKLSYHLHDVHRGDIVVFGRPPGERASENIKDLVKRVIGLPGETISSANGEVEIDGKPLKEPWLPKGTELGQPIAPFKIQANDYFVLGDNRTNSQDSRFFGPIPHSLIVGRVVMRIWPLSHITFF